MVLPDYTQIIDGEVSGRYPEPGDFQMNNSLIKSKILYLTERFASLMGLTEHYPLLIMPI